MQGNRREPVSARNNSRKLVGDVSPRLRRNDDTQSAHPEPMARLRAAFYTGLPFQAVSSNSSRPISQRRISDVPAPIS
jgi:hypothetical protein